MIGILPQRFQSFFVSSSGLLARSAAPYCRQQQHHHLRSSISSSTVTLNNDQILLRHDDAENAVTTLTLNNPKKYNVLSSAMLDELQLQLDDIAKNESISVCIIAGTGKAFSAGHDLKEIHLHKTNEDTVSLFRKCSKVMMSVNKLPQPVIAKVNGVAAAAGCQLGESDVAVLLIYSVCI